MKITNECNFPVQAFCFAKDWNACGGSVTIQPGETEHVTGPYIGQMDGSCHLAIEGSVTCHESVDEEDQMRFQIISGAPLSLAVNEQATRGVIVLHHEDPIPALAQVQMAKNAEQSRAMV